jgi:hypothetical protein
MLINCGLGGGNVTPPPSPLLSLQPDVMKADSINATVKKLAMLLMRFIQFLLYRLSCTSAPEAGIYSSIKYSIPTA